MKELASKITSRRALLSGAALLAGGIALAGCSATQIATAQADWATIVGTIQSGVAAAAAYIPTVESIAATAASLFGPAYEAIVVAGSAALNQVIATLTNVIGVLAPPVVASLQRRLATSSRGAPISIGTTSTGVPVVGFKVG